MFYVASEKVLRIFLRRVDDFYYPPEWSPKKVLRISLSESVHLFLLFYLCLLMSLCAHVFVPVRLIQGGLNKFHDQHALRELARKLDQGILIIRSGSCHITFFRI